MAGTASIPLTVLAVGEHDFGPDALADTDSTATLSIDRTVSKGATQGFNGQPATTEALIEVRQSNDGGATWFQLAAVTFFGGVYTLKGGGTLNANGFTVTLPPGTGRQAMAAVTVSGASVAVQGSLVIA